MALPKNIKLPKVSGKMKMVLFAGAMAVVVPKLAEKEGLVLHKYRDPVNVLTYCYGETDMKFLLNGKAITKKFCKDLLAARAEGFADKVYAKLRVGVTENTLAAHTHFAYNIGINGYGRSRTLRLTNAGDMAGGCRAMIGWYTAGGRDCRIKANNCYGLINRRNEEIDLCLKGTTEEEIENYSAWIKADGDD